VSKDSKVGPVDKLNVGLIFLTSNWFRQVGLQDENSSLSQEVEKIAEEIRSEISDYCNPVYPGLIYSEELAREAAGLFREADIKALIISPLMWCEDQILRAVLKSLPELPIILLTIQPSYSLPDFLVYQEMLKGSGTVGSLQFSGMLRREGWSYSSLNGYRNSEDLNRQISAHLTSLQIVESLRFLKVGILPFPCDQMSTTFVDDFVLRKTYGIETRYIELQRVREIAENCGVDEISNFKKICSRAHWKINVSDEEFDAGISYALALNKLRKEETLGVLALNDVISETHDTFGMRPILDNPELSETDFTVSMEADVASGVGMYILKKLSGVPVLYTEVLGVDFKNNELLLGHCGYHDTRLADPEYPVSVVSDVEYKTVDKYEGATNYFKRKPGTVTIVNSVFHGERFTWSYITGESLEGQPRLEDTTHLMFSPDVPVRDFIDRSIDRGVSQHWIVVEGDIGERLHVLARWMDLELINIATNQDTS